MELVGVEVLASETVAEESERDHPLAFAQLTSLATPSSQSFGAGGRDVKALMSLTLFDMPANFNLEFSGRVDPEALASLHFSIVEGGLVGESEPKVVAIIAPELSPISMMNVITLRQPKVE